MPGRVFGEIRGIPQGTTFRDRTELSARQVHRPTRAGISGAAHEGADSIVVSGGYEDDQDYGDVIIYTGHGGRDPNTGRQVADQELELGNLALARSHTDGLPVRVIRGANLASPYAPKTGYRYDGLYFVESYGQDRGRHGFRVWRYRLVRVDTVPAALDGIPPPGTATATPIRRVSTVQRIIRNTLVTLRVKTLYDYTCQVCGIRLVTEAGPYAEGGHIRPLGSPHDGPDTEDNVLCFCPNHHVLFDLGALPIADNLTFRDPLTGMSGILRTHPHHFIHPAHLAYHRSLF